jgi:hypothetical protein
MPRKPRVMQRSEDGVPEIARCYPEAYEELLQEKVSAVSSPIHPPPVPVANSRFPPPIVTLLKSNYPHTLTSVSSYPAWCSLLRYRPVPSHLYQMSSMEALIARAVVCASHAPDAAAPPAAAPLADVLPPTEVFESARTNFRMRAAFKIWRETSRGGLTLSTRYTLPATCYRPLDSMAPTTCQHASHYLLLIRFPLLAANTLPATC